MQNIEVAIVTTTNWNGVLTFFINPPRSDSTEPIFCSIPPKATATITRLLVQSMLSIPPLFTSFVNSAFPDSAS